MKEYYGYGKNKEDKRYFDFKQQRKYHGFDDTELWNLDNTLAKWLLPRIVRFREIDVVARDKEWENDLDNIVDALSMLADESLLPTLKDKEYMQNGLNLLAKNIFGFWN